MYIYLCIYTSIYMYEYSFYGEVSSFKGEHSTEARFPFFLRSFSLPFCVCINIYLYL